MIWTKLAGVTSLDPLSVYDASGMRVKILMKWASVLREQDTDRPLFLPFAPEDQGEGMP